jgi:hypothetical protein
MTRMLSLLFVLLAVSASAQTGKSESCETVTPNQAAATMKADEKRAVAFCGDQVADAGPVLRDGGNPDTRDDARFIRDELPASNGLFYFATKLLDFSVGAHNLTVDYVRLAPGGGVVTAMTPPPLLLTVQPTDDGCTGAVVLAVGDWTRAANAGDSGRVLLTLGRSKQPVTEVWTFLDGAPVPSTTANPNPKKADDLRGIAGVYFVVPAGAGAHKVSVSAKTAAGCEDGASRPMTLVVQ